MIIPLGILLIVLKLAHVIGWSWWIVMLPLWIIPVTYLGTAVSFLTASFCYYFTKFTWQKHKQTKLT